MLHFKDAFYYLSGFGTWKCIVMCFVSQKNLFLLSTIICTDYLFHHCLLYFSVKGKILLTCYSAFLVKLQTYQGYVGSTSECSLTLWHFKRLSCCIFITRKTCSFIHCTRIHWTAAGALGAQGEAEMSSINKQ